MKTPFLSEERTDEKAGTAADIERVGELLLARLRQVSHDITERCHQVCPDTTPEMPRLSDDRAS